MKLTVFYDYTCPFCYITCKNVGILSEEFDLDIEWRGIEIHPEYPGEGQRSRKSLKSRRTVESIRGAAEESGIELLLPGFRTNSRLALEASELAKDRNRFGTFHNSIYNAYFVEKKNIGDIEIVLETGADAGLDRNELEACLKSRSMYRRIEDNKKAAETNMVRGVPTLIMGGFPVHGNQSLETLRLMTKRAIERSVSDRVTNQDK